MITLVLLRRDEFEPCDDCTAAAQLGVRTARSPGPHDGGWWRFCIPDLGRRLQGWIEEAGQP